MNSRQFSIKVLFTTCNIVLLFLFLFYLLFPTVNSTADAYQYASSVKYGIDLFSPHHLLYNVFNYLIFQVVSAPLSHLDALVMMKVVNACFATLNLWLLFRILQLVPGFKSNNGLILVFFAGSAFGIMRFATEAETYIIPIFFSLLGSYFFYKYFLKEDNQSALFLSGLFASMACLFHQIHFFWWLGLLIGIIFYGRKVRLLLIFSFSALLVPVVYYWVLVSYQHEPGDLFHLQKFIFNAYANGSVKSSFGLPNIILTIISFIRTFFQVHGKCIYLLHRFPLLWMAAGIVAILLFNSIFPVRKINQPLTPSLFFKTHFIILVLHMLFATYAVGNAEFMVMVPYLISLLLPSFSINFTRILFVATGMFIWNIAFGLAPDANIHYNNNIGILDKIDLYKNHPFILQNGLTLSGQYFYIHGHESPNLEITSPAIIHRLEGRVLDGIKTGNYVYTDAGKNTTIYSRSSLLEQKAYKKFFEKYKLVKADSITNFFGNTVLYKVVSFK